MAFIVVTNPWSSLSPAFGLDVNVVWARTNLVWQLLSLGSTCRHVRIHHGFIEVSDRSWWVRRTTQMIPIEQVSHIDYGYAEVVSGANAWGQATDAIEKFSVAVVMRKEHGGRRVPLFDFWGEGNVAPVLGSALVDDRGAQESESLGFVDLLRRQTQLPMGEPIPSITDAEGRGWACSACGRESGPAGKKCLYCGGDVVRS